ncbi:nitrogenase-stabilizing/protective protein NifW [Zymomonas mobilis]|uniref:nitrogenase-stabilizing/protective protein NifW n=1 Tax=Zymomonas mobilis TaxID=542 RepID=UPI0021C3D383|nr:nitrogenase-stabilizing/protective protein NifW [Zymomonas mobilis]MCP9308333.1 nitrogenase-stabilizing/protective protein NifW [Zymomonas mobilis]
MSFADTLRQLSSAEDFFSALHVDYDPQILNVARLHILRKMRLYLEADKGDLADESLQKQQYQHYLTQAYNDFVHSSPIKERLFKVHQEAVKPVKLPMVKLTSLTMPPE